MPLAPMKESDAPNEELRQAWEYYHTPRAQYPTAPGYQDVELSFFSYYATVVKRGFLADCCYRCHQ